MKVFEKTKKSLYKTLFLMTSALFVVAFVSCKQPTGPEQSSEQPTEEDSGKAPEKKPEPPVDNNIFLGTWAWNYGYDQENFTEERLTLYKDKTFFIHATFPNGWGEDDKGTYEIVTDSTYGQTLRLNITSYKDSDMQVFDSVNVLISYKCYFDGEDTMHLDRFKKDFSRQGGPVYDFNPSVRNTYYRVKDGTKDNLVGKWCVNKIGTQCDWDETWTFNTDGTMVDDWTEAGQSPETYNGTYEVTQKDGKNILHQILHWGTEKPEWWYEYKSYGPNVISVQLVESTSEGKVSNAPINYYYRYIETETFTYHISRVALTHVVPKASSYTLIDNACQLYNFGNYFSGQEFVFEGWYDNQNLEGNKVTTSNGTTKEFWSKNAPRINKNQWGQGAKEYNYCFDAYIDNVIPGMDFNPNKGDCLVITIEGTLESDLDGWTILSLTDRTNNGWRPIAQEGKSVTTKDKKFKTVYTLNIPTDAEFPSDKKMFSLNFTYEKEACDRPNVLYNGKVTYKLLDNTNSYSVKYHIGQFTKETRAPVNEDYTLTKDMMDFESVHWNLGHYVASGSWYANENFTGSPITAINN